MLLMEKKEVEEMTERKDKHVVLVCWAQFRAQLFVSCDEQS